MSDKELALKAFRAMTDAQQQKMIPILLSFAKNFPRASGLRLIVNNK
jgi:hypothetical protein